MHPFVEADYQGSYRESLSAPVYGLWSGKLDRDGFMEAFELAIEVGIRKAWKEGMEKGGIDWEDRTEEDEITLADFVLGEYKHVAGFADFIEMNSKKNGGKLASLQMRLSMWVNAYNRAVAAAFALAAENPLVTHVMGATEEHCSDCSYASGRIYRKKTWEKWGWESPPAIGVTECNGYKCECRWDPVPKGTRANKGHPRRPHGPN